jgi:hypothetical protein
MSKTKENFEVEMYGESLNSTDYYFHIKKQYEEYELSKNSSIFVTPISENDSEKLGENKVNLLKEEDYEKKLL